MKYAMDRTTLEGREIAVLFAQQRRKTPDQMREAPSSYVALHICHHGALAACRSIVFSSHAAKMMSQSAQVTLQFALPQKVSSIESCVCFMYHLKLTFCACCIISTSKALATDAETILAGTCASTSDF